MIKSKILKICEKYKPYVLFTTDEEIGGVGATKVTEQINDIPVKFMIEIDRRGNNQVVYYRCGNEDFQKYIESFGFDKQYGSFSDVSTLSTFYDIAGCNVSAGYYNEHTNTEHIFLEHLYNTISKIKRILRDYDSEYYDCKETKTYYCGKCYDYYDYYDDYLPSNNKADKNNVEVTEIEDDEFKSYLEMEDDFYDLTKQEWYEKYGKEIYMKTKYEVEEEDILANKKPIKIAKTNRFNTVTITPDDIVTRYNLVTNIVDNILHHENVGTIVQTGPYVTYRPAENFYDYYTGEWNND